MAEEKSAQQLEAEQLQKDVESFNGELIPLLGKYNVGLGATAFITPDGKIGARPTLFRAPTAEKKPEVDKPAEATPEAPAAPAETKPESSEV